MDANTRKFVQDNCISCNDLPKCDYFELIRDGEFKPNLAKEAAHGKNGQFDKSVSTPVCPKKNLALKAAKSRNWVE
jgi:ssDNA-binding Zn-finger/Zn-ribbon topoisomerase 1